MVRITNKSSGFYAVVHCYQTVLQYFALAQPPPPVPFLRQLLKAILASSLSSVWVFLLSVWQVDALHIYQLGVGPNPTPAKKWGPYSLLTALVPGRVKQRVLNDFYKAEGQAFSPSYDLAPPPPPPPSHVSKFDRRHTGRLRKRDKLLTGGGSRIIRRRESLVLYKSFNSCNTLWL